MLLVVLFHAGLNVPGGFIGVDVFFVISGFVIGRGLVAEAERNGTISLSQFYARRIRRLLPALAVMRHDRLDRLGHHPGPRVSSQPNAVCSSGSRWRRFHCRTSSCGPRAAGTSARSTSRTPSSTRGRWASRSSSTSYSRCSSSWHGASSGVGHCAMGRRCSRRSSWSRRWPAWSARSCGRSVSPRSPMSYRRPPGSPSTDRSAASGSSSPGCWSPSPAGPCSSDGSVRGRETIDRVRPWAGAAGLILIELRSRHRRPLPVGGAVLVIAAGAGITTRLLSTRRSSGATVRTAGTSGTGGDRSRRRDVPVGPGDRGVGPGSLACPVARQRFRP